MTLILGIGHMYDADTKNMAHMTLILRIGHI